jgi:hypothetical protein
VPLTAGSVPRAYVIDLRWLRCAASDAEGLSVAAVLLWAVGFFVIMFGWTCGNCCDRRPGHIGGHG